MRFGSWRDIGRGLWWGSAIGCGWVLATLLDQYLMTGGLSSRSTWP